MHQPSAPTPEYGAPALTITSRGSRRGRCANCTTPIYDDQDARQLPVIGRVHYAGGETRPRPYQHTECPK